MSWALCAYLDSADATQKIEYYFYCFFDFAISVSISNFKNGNF